MRRFILGLFGFIGTVIAGLIVVFIATQGAETPFEITSVSLLSHDYKRHQLVGGDAGDPLDVPAGVYVRFSPTRASTEDVQVEYELFLKELDSTEPIPTCAVSGNVDLKTLFLRNDYRKAAFIDTKLTERHFIFWSANFCISGKGMLPIDRVYAKGDIWFDALTSLPNWSPNLKSGRLYYPFHTCRAELDAMRKANLPRCQAK